MLVAIRTQVHDHVKMRLTSQLIKGISKVLQKLLKYFSGTIISTFFVPSSPVIPVIFTLKLIESVGLPAVNSVISSLLSWAGVSLQYCYKLPVVFA